MAPLQKPTSAIAADLVKKLRQDNSIPALDENVTQLCRLTGQSETRTTDLATVIMRDAALTSRLLALANSAAYRPRNPVKTISSAVIMLGFERVRQLAFGLSLFHKHAESIRDKELYRLLVCAYCTGLFAMTLARRLHDETPEELFVAGLLHQLPRLALFNGFPEMYREMDHLVVQGKSNLEQACTQVFGASYEAMTLAMADHWKLPGPCRFYAAETGGKTVPRREAVFLGVSMANLIFGNTPAGRESAARVTEATAKVLAQDTFSLPDFVAAAAKTDPSMESFFSLSPEDIAMMARIAEWGKVNSAEVANTLTASFEQLSSEKIDEEPLVMAHFLSELMIAIRNRNDVNSVLMLALEGLFRCVRADCVIAAFVDGKRQRLQGRLYAGHRSNMAVDRYQAELHATEYAAVQNLKGTEVVNLSAKSNKIIPNKGLLAELDIDAVLLAPIRVRDRAIGQFFLGRRTGEPPFAADDCLWVMAIAGHVAIAFEASE